MPAVMMRMMLTGRLRNDARSPVKTLETTAPRKIMVRHFELLLVEMIVALVRFRPLVRTLQTTKTLVHSSAIDF